ncbi:TVP38/TMEM64 family protein [Peribacillus cavernae]|uniref:TVP38/TMEM64 family membrane protein n=1 Tax=Peribacillus cavernae TaxID=1674310 RepID=A0A3S0W2T0_9BACI|nr:VTT domain-containing protein [Peribacillus cavernae]MDQ0220107.1 putative membrane protein YdjX (TVP38/TMEM64 family) [Peribacillus cavernae]RUQ25467.1 TVP38/TMEM64 family protein [Peribacillus cavernae]
MNEELSFIVGFIGASSILAPFIFVTLHLLRQFLFIPVAIICISGGILFGPAAGTIYSILGLTLSSLLFYLVIRKFPKTMERLLKLKNKLFGRRNLNVGQITVLRLIPFVHYHLLSLCLMEKKQGLKNFAYYSFLTNIPLAFFYTVFGSYISEFSPTMIVILLFSLTVLLYLMREKYTVITWKEFFQTANDQK